MRRALLLVVALPALGAASKADLPPPSPEAWKVPDSLAKEPAVVVEERWTVTDDRPAVPPKDAGWGLRRRFAESDFPRGHQGVGIEVATRVRVLSEAGRQALLGLDVWVDRVEDVRCTVYRPDGSSTVLDGARDALAKTLVAVGRERMDRVTVAIPGVSADCIVDLRYWVPLVEPGRELPIFTELPLGSHLPVRSLRIEVPGNLRLDHKVYVSPELRAEIGGDEVYRTYIFRDLPPRQPEPFALEPLRGYPSLGLYEPLRQLSVTDGSSAPALWVALAPEVRDDVADPSEGSRLRTFKDEGKAFAGPHFTALMAPMKEGLPEGSRERAAELLARIHKAVALRGAETSEERRGPVTKGDPSLALERIAESREAGPLGYRKLFFHALRAVGLAPSVLLVCDARRRFFRYERPDPAQFDRELLAIRDEAGRLVVFDPLLRFQRPGLLLPWHQGGVGLLIDGASAQVKQVRIEAQDASLNTTEIAAVLDLRDGASLTATVEAAFTGFPAYQAKEDLLPMDEADRDKALKTRLSALEPELQLEQVRMEALFDGALPFRWSLRARADLEGDRSSIDPFLYATPPVVAPGSWPEGRQGPIVLACRSRWRVRTELRMPRGWRVEAPPAFSERNSLGEVAWSCVPDPERPEIFVAEISVRVEAFAAPPSAYGDLKALVGWVDQVVKRRLRVSRGAS